MKKTSSIFLSLRSSIYNNQGKKCSWNTKRTNISEQLYHSVLTSSFVHKGPSNKKELVWLVSASCSSKWGQRFQFSKSSLDSDPKPEMIDRNTTITSALSRAQKWLCRALRNVIWGSEDHPWSAARQTDSVVLCSSAPV